MGHENETERAVRAVDDGEDDSRAAREPSRAIARLSTAFFSTARQGESFHLASAVGRKSCCRAVSF